MKGIASVLLALATAILASTAAPDTLLLDAIENAPVNSPAGLERPTHGMTMDQVRKRFGPADQELAPVGDPPISRWVYPRYTVYFEHQYVLTSVVHR